LIGQKAVVTFECASMGVFHLIFFHHGETQRSRDFQKKRQNEKESAKHAKEVSCLSMCEIKIYIKLVLSIPLSLPHSKLCNISIIDV